MEPQQNSSQGQHFVYTDSQGYYEEEVNDQVFELDNPRCPREPTKRNPPLPRNVDFDPEQVLLSNPEQVQISEP